MFGERDADGFYWGEVRGRKGFIPENTVAEVTSPDAGADPYYHRGDRVGDTYAATPVKKMVALYDYDPQELSPNVDADVSVAAGRRHSQAAFKYHVVARVDAFLGPTPAPGLRAWSRSWGPHPPLATFALLNVAAVLCLCFCLLFFCPVPKHALCQQQVELSFRTGNIIYVYGEMDDDGFYMGELDGVRGLVPSNFLTPLKKHQEADYRNGGPQGRGGPMGPMGPMQRGHGPGARGPPPPPREGMPRPRQGEWHGQARRAWDTLLFPFGVVCLLF